MISKLLTRFGFCLEDTRSFGEKVADEWVEQNREAIEKLIYDATVEGHQEVRLKDDFPKMRWAALRRYLIPKGFRLSNYGCQPYIIEW